MRFHSSHKLSNVERGQWQAGRPQQLLATLQHIAIYRYRDWAPQFYLPSVSIDSAHHLYGDSEMRTVEKQVRIAWSTIRLPWAAPQDDDNYAGMRP